MSEHEEPIEPGSAIGWALVVLTGLVVVNVIFWSVAFARVVGAGH